jgi:nitrogenase subunit NifH
MSLILTIIAAFVPLLQSLIGGSNTNLIQTALTALATLITSWGKNPTSDASAALTTLQTVLTALKADTSLDPKVLAQIAEADSVVAAGIAGVQFVETSGWNLATYTPPPAVS